MARSPFTAAASTATAAPSYRSPRASTAPSRSFRLSRCLRFSSVCFFEFLGLLLVLLAAPVSIVCFLLVLLVRAAAALASLCASAFRGVRTLHARPKPSPQLAACACPAVSRLDRSWLYDSSLTVGAQFSLLGRLPVSELRRRFVVAAAKDPKLLCVPIVSGLNCRWAAVPPENLQGSPMPESRPPDGRRGGRRRRLVAPSNAAGAPSPGGTNATRNEADSSRAAEALRGPRAEAAARCDGGGPSMAGGSQAAGPPREEPPTVERLAELVAERQVFRMADLPATSRASIRRHLRAGGCLERLALSRLERRVGAIASWPVAPGAPLWWAVVIEQPVKRRGFFRRSRRRRAAGAAASDRGRVVTSSPRSVAGRDANIDAWEPNAPLDSSRKTPETLVVTHVVFVVHHAIADGIALAHRLLPRLLDPPRPAPGDHEVEATLEADAEAMRASVAPQNGSSPSIAAPSSPSWLVRTVKASAAAFRQGLGTAFIASVLLPLRLPLLCLPLLLLPTADPLVGRLGRSAPKARQAVNKRARNHRSVAGGPPCPRPSTSRATAPWGHAVWRRAVPLGRSVCGPLYIPLQWLQRLRRRVAVASAGCLRPTINDLLLYALTYTTSRYPHGQRRRRSCWSWGLGWLAPGWHLWSVMMPVSGRPLDVAPSGLNNCQSPLPLVLCLRNEGEEHQPEDQKRGEEQPLAPTTSAATLRSTPPRHRPGDGRRPPAGGRLASNGLDGAFWASRARRLEDVMWSTGVLKSKQLGTTMIALLSLLSLLPLEWLEVRRRLSSAPLPIDRLASSSSLAAFSTRRSSSTACLHCIAMLHFPLCTPPQPCR
eukprot:GHVT01038975.1.p1 GENE.GHVT01038975.1~~GHVT01038975.1.p1  ORF type:complete len:827 (-),score=170.52 GHVT01038975.1:405-2885(-)